MVTLESVIKKEDALQRQYEQGKESINKLYTRIVECDDKDLEKLAGEKQKLEDQMKAILEILAGLRLKKTELELAKQHEAELKERERKERLVNKILKEPPPVCERCESSFYVKPVEDVACFVHGGWTTPVTDYRQWHLEYECHDCNNTILVYPDAPEEERIQQ